MVSELEEVKAAIVETAQTIDRVEQEIAETVRLERQAKVSNDVEELRAMREKANKLRDEKNKLRDEKNKLREKENKLRDEKNKLREKELYLLQRRDSEVAAEAVVGLFHWPQVFEMVDPSSSIPDAKEMGAFVQSMLPNGGIPVPLDITIPPIFAGSFYNRRLHSSDSSVVAQMLTPTFTVTSGSEMQMQLNWDRFFTALSRLAVTHDMRYQLSRNTASNSLSGITEASRPDFLLLVDGKALLFGEEKSESRQIGDAARELSEKLRWDSFTLGEQLPYILGYAAAGTHVQLFLLLRQGTRVAISPELDVQVVDHRFWLARAVAHILRLLPALSRLLPSESIPIGQTLQRAPGVALTINGDSVLKVLTSEVEHVNCARLRTFYETICPQLEHAIQCDMTRSSWTESKTKLRLYPLGLHVSEDEQRRLSVVVHVVQSVLSALSHLHELGWCHRDVRWGNVLRRGDGKFMLIDFEFAAAAGNIITWRNRYLPPEVVPNVTPWGCAQDICQVGMLLSGVLPQSTSVLELYAQLVHTDPLQRPGARAAMQHPSLARVI